MKSLSPVPIAAMLLLTVGAFSERALAQQENNPACGQDILIRRGLQGDASQTVAYRLNLTLQSPDAFVIRYHLNQPQNTLAGDCNNYLGGVSQYDPYSMPWKLVASPSGLADISDTDDPFPGLFMAVVAPNSTAPFTGALASASEWWAVTVKPYDTPELALSPAQTLECNDEAIEPFAPFAYTQLLNPGGSNLNANPAILQPTGSMNGGAGFIAFETKFCPHGPDPSGAGYCYGPYLSLPCHSTDLDGDGDTDLTDETALLSHWHTDYAPCDYNWDHIVDQTDLNILLREANRRLNGQPYMRATCHTADEGATFTKYYTGPYVPIPPSTIASLSATPGSNNTIQLQWTAPGNTGTYGTATQYDLRWSNSCITADNFANATPITTNAPHIAGTTESVTFQGQASTKYYFAIKTLNDLGATDPANWSAVSNVATNPYVPPLTLGAGIGTTTTTTTFTLPNSCSSLSWEVRVASLAITTQTAWNAATSLATGYDAPGTTRCIPQTSLSPGKYYFAGRYTDGGVQSPLSNSPGGTLRTNGIEVDCGGNRLEREVANVSELALSVRGANPTASTVGLDYAVPSSSFGAPMRLGIYDVSGRLVRSLDSGPAQAGQHQTSWNLLDNAGNAIPRGLYFARFVVGSDVRTRSIVVNR